MVRLTAQTAYAYHRSAAHSASVYHLLLNKQQCSFGGGT